VDQKERDKFDEYEASGVLARFRDLVRSFCAPIWWEARGTTVLANGSMSIIATTSAVFGVTNDHVLRIYEKHKAANADVFCQLGSGPFDPVQNVIDRSDFWDLATFLIPPLTLQRWGHQIWQAEVWPPATIRSGDGVVLGGDPENRRSTDSSPKPRQLFVDFVSFIPRAENWSDEHMSFCFDSTSWYWPQGVELAAHPNLKMARRSEDWNVGLAQDLRSPEFAREFLLGAVEEGVPVQVALAKVIRAMGVKEFAAKVRMASPNVLRAINPRHNPTQDTLNRLLRPFKLRLTLAPLEPSKGRHAA
jgi:DNA-binding phage protein